MSGDIDLAKNDITNISDSPPTDSSINKKYVDYNYIPKSISNSIDMSNNLADDSSLSSVKAILFYQNLVEE